MDYDLKLQVGRPEADILAYSQVMANASPVFRKMLEPNRFAEGELLSKSGQLTLPLPDDNAEAMKILCNIFHFRHDKIPVANMTFSLLAEVAILVDKYDCAPATKMWGERWLDRFHQRKELETISNCDFASIGKCIYVSFLWQYNTFFRPMTVTLILHASAADFSSNPLLLHYGKLPISAQDKIQDARKAGIESLHRLCYNLLNQLKEGQHCKRKNQTLVPDKFQKDSFNCNSMALGNLILAMKEAFGYGWEDLENWSESIDFYHKGLLGVAARLDGALQLPSHNGCGLSSKISTETEERYRRAGQGLEIRPGNTPGTEIVQGTNIFGVPGVPFHFTSLPPTSTLTFGSRV